MDCSARIDGDVLVIDNSRICRRWRFGDGDLVGLSIEDKAAGHTWTLFGRQGDFALPGVTIAPSGGRLETAVVAATARAPRHLRADVTFTLGAIEVRRSFRVYPDCPAIACDIAVRGRPADTWAAAVAATGDRKPATTSFTERLELPGRHWRVTAEEFFDRTDHCDNLVREHSLLPFDQQGPLKGNLLFAQELLADRGLVLLKEAPCSDMQLAYEGCDFVCRPWMIEAVGIGIAPRDLVDGQWIPGYGVVLCVTSGGQLGALRALRDYQRRVRTHLPQRDDMILMNTWGDRGGITRPTEAFCLAELEAGSRLGITHFQIDAGWQTGQTPEAPFGGESLRKIWDYPNYWHTHPTRFPNGLGPVVRRGRELGIEVCVWFNPSIDDSFAHWQDDARTLIGLHREYGIRTFKIDGVEIPDKRAEMNLRRMFETIMDAIGQDAVFNLDVTAGRRFGYHCFNKYGNAFLENRYTDWVNYYPHHTLRNLWMLSRFVPTQNLQIEFLNSWRNAAKYGADDTLAPSRVSFDYIFAITMMSQPLAWFEATGLPAEAFEIAPLVRTYRQHQQRIHEGLILPIGQEPCGTGWTGFQSIGERGGYVLVFRELNDRPAAELTTWGLEGRNVRFKAIAGHGKDFAAKAGADGRIPFALPAPFTFALYEYEVD